MNKPKPAQGSGGTSATSNTSTKASPSTFANNNNVSLKNSTTSSTTGGRPASATLGNAKPSVIGTPPQQRPTTTPQIQGAKKSVAPGKSSNSLVLPLPKNLSNPQQASPGGKAKKSAQNVQKLYTAPATSSSRASLGSTSNVSLKSGGTAKPRSLSVPPTSNSQNLNNQNSNPSTGPSKTASTKSSLGNSSATTQLRQKVPQANKVPYPTPIFHMKSSSIYSRSTVLLEKSRNFRAFVEKAINEHKIFQCCGVYPSIKKALKRRGWVEKPGLLHSRSTNAALYYGTRKSVHHDDETDSAWLARVMQNHPPDFIWVIRRDNIDWRALTQFQTVNRFPRAWFTTKTGLTACLQHMHWFSEAGISDTFYPRCYRLCLDEERQAFQDDYRLTACMSLLRYFVTTFEKKGGASALIDNHSKVTPLALDFACRQLGNYIRMRRHEDIDWLLPPSFMTQHWDAFLRQYYAVVHERKRFRFSNSEAVQVKYENARKMLNKIAQYWPQVSLDGVYNMWICKPGARSRGNGIVIKNQLEKILDLMYQSSFRECNWVVQKYIERPLLIYRTKFDIRQWFLVTDWTPLTVWFYKESYIRFCTKPFVLEDFHESIHLCNNAIQARYQNAATRDPNLPDENMWSSDTFRQYLRSLSRPEAWSQIYSGMKQAIVGVLLSSQETIESRKGCFELYGADFMLSDDFKPWLIEINSSPCMAGTTSVTSRMCGQCLEDTIKVVIDRKHNRNADTGNFELIYRQNVGSIPTHNFNGHDITVIGKRLSRDLDWPMPLSRNASNNMRLKNRESQGGVSNNNGSSTNNSKQTLSDVLQKLRGQTQEIYQTSKLASTVDARETKKARGSEVDDKKWNEILDDLKQLPSVKKKSQTQTDVIESHISLQGMETDSLSTIFERATQTLLQRSEIPSKTKLTKAPPKNKLKSNKPEEEYIPPPDIVRFSPSEIVRSINRSIHEIISSKDVSQLSFTEYKGPPQEQIQAANAARNQGLARTTEPPQVPPTNVRKMIAAEAVEVPQKQNNTEKQQAVGTGKKQAAAARNRKKTPSLESEPPQVPLGIRKMLLAKEEEEREPKAIEEKKGGETTTVSRVGSQSVVNEGSALEQNQAVNMPVTVPNEDRKQVEIPIVEPPVVEIPIVEPPVVEKEVPVVAKLIPDRVEEKPDQNQNGTLLPTNDMEKKKSLYRKVLERMTTDDMLKMINHSILEVMPQREESQKRSEKEQEQAVVNTVPESGKPQTTLEPIPQVCPDLAMTKDDYEDAVEMEEEMISADEEHDGYMEVVDMTAEEELMDLGIIKEESSHLLMETEQEMDLIDFTEDRNDEMETFKPPDPKPDHRTSIEETSNLLREALQKIKPHRDRVKSSSQTQTNIVDSQMSLHIIDFDSPSTIFERATQTLLQKSEIPSTTKLTKAPPKLKMTPYHAPFAKDVEETTKALYGEVRMTTDQMLRIVNESILEVMNQRTPRQKRKAVVPNAVPESSPINVESLSQISSAPAILTDDEAEEMEASHHDEENCDDDIEVLDVTADEREEHFQEFMDLDLDVIKEESNHLLMDTEEESMELPIDFTEMCQEEVENSTPPPPEPETDLQNGIDEAKALLLEILQKMAADDEKGRSSSSSLLLGRKMRDTESQYSLDSTNDGPSSEGSRPKTRDSESQSCFDSDAESRPRPYTNLFLTIVMLMMSQTGWQRQE